MEVKRWKIRSREELDCNGPVFVVLKVEGKHSPFTPDKRKKSLGKQKKKGLGRLE